MSPIRYRAATFDCYGTLVDWEGGAAAFLYDLALRRGEPKPPAGRVLRERWEGIQFGLLGGPYRPYRSVLGESLHGLADERGWTLAADDPEAFVRSMGAWQPFPDTRPALARARAAGLRLVIVSNTDRAIMAHTLRQLELPFDDVLVAEDVRAYKPSEAVFRAALERVGERPEHVLHVAFGFRYDIGPAARLGMATAWVNRHAEPLPGPVMPDHEWRDLWGLADLAEGVARGR